MLYNNAYEELEEVVVTEEITSGHSARLVVYNDDVNTFDHVIKCFCEILQHTNQQAEQLSIIIHSKGKATVKTATRKELRPKREALLDRGISAVIEEDNN